MIAASQSGSKKCDQLGAPCTPCLHTFLRPALFDQRLLCDIVFTQRDWLQHKAGRGHNNTQHGSLAFALALALSTTTAAAAAASASQAPLQLSQHRLRLPVSVFPCESDDLDVWPLLDGFNLRQGAVAFNAALQKSRPGTNSTGAEQTVGRSGQVGGPVCSWCWPSTRLMARRRKHRRDSTAVLRLCCYRTPAITCGMARPCLATGTVPSTSGASSSRACTAG